MPTPPVEPLEPELWFEQTRTIAARIARLGDEAPDAVIRKAFFLIQLTPGPLRHVVSCQIEEAELERMLACEAYDAAVAALVGAPLGVEMAREPEQDVIRATVRLPGDGIVGVASDRTIARALLAAWSRCLDSLFSNATLDLNLDRGLRKGPPGRLPRSSPH